MDAHDDPRTADRAEANAAPDADASAGTDVKQRPKPSALFLFVACLAIIMCARIYYLGLWRPVLLPLGLFYGALTSAPMAALCLVPQLFVPRRLKSRTLLRISLSMLPAVALAGWTVVLGLAMPSILVKGTFDGEEFASLPASATGIKAYRWTAGFSYGAWVRFTASPGDLEAFLAASPELREAELERFNRDRMLISKRPDENAHATEGGSKQHVYAPPPPFAPSWYVPEIREKGGRYMSPSGYTVIVNEATGTVYIYDGD